MPQAFVSSIERSNDLIRELSGCVRVSSCPSRLKLATICIHIPLRDLFLCLLNILPDSNQKIKFNSSEVHFGNIWDYITIAKTCGGCAKFSASPTHILVSC